MWRTKTAAHGCSWYSLQNLKPPPVMYTRDYSTSFAPCMRRGSRCAATVLRTNRRPKDQQTWASTYLHQRNYDPPGDPGARYQ